MIVRDKVFVVEQGCSAEAEIDSDDLRSWEWVVYAQPSNATTDDIERCGIPVAVIRLVPPPHAPHETLHHPERTADLPKYDLAHEPYVKITRVAVLKEFRGYGLTRLLMKVVEDWAAQNQDVINFAYCRELVPGSIIQEGWTGLAILHAQVQVEKMYQRLGYEVDKSLGVWDEEGIDHVGMFKRLQLS
jgi:predicted GNAT family N-acyltransferase